MIGAYGNYLAPLATESGVTIKGQSLGIVIPIVMFPIALILWLQYRGRPSRSTWLQVFLGGLVVAWCIHFTITRFHNDMYVHTIWLFIPIVLMISLKTPSSVDAWQALVALAWSAAIIMVLTRALEMANVIPQWFYPTPDQAQWEINHYWLPFAGHFGIASRWPGPFGFNSKTGFVAVFLVITALARWQRISSPVFLTIGVLGMLLTGGRGVYISALAGILVLLLFSQRSFTSRIPPAIRIGILVLAVSLVAFKFAFSPTATTGRIGEDGIWNSFLDLWRTSPVIGVGLSGIWKAPGRAGEAMDAHSIFVQEVAQFGLLGFVSQYAVLTVGILISLRSALKNWSGPLAVLAIYLIAGTTDLLHNGWQQASMHVLIVVLAVLSAGQLDVRNQNTAVGVCTGHTKVRSLVKRSLH